MTTRVLKFKRQTKGTLVYVDELDTGQANPREMQFYFHKSYFSKEQTMEDKEPKRLIMTLEIKKSTKKKKTQKVEEENDN